MNEYSLAGIYALLAFTTTMPKGKYASGAAFPEGLTFNDGCEFGNVTFSKGCKVGHNAVIKGNVVANGTNFGNSLKVTGKAVMHDCVIGIDPTIKNLDATKTRISTSSNKVSTIDIPHAVLRECRVGRAARVSKIKFTAKLINATKCVFHTNVSANVIVDNGGAYPIGFNVASFEGNSSTFESTASLTATKSFLLTSSGTVKIPSFSSLHMVAITAPRILLAGGAKVSLAMLDSPSVDLYKNAQISSRGYNFSAFDNVAQVVIYGSAIIDGHKVKKFATVNNLGSCGRTTKIAVTNNGPLVSTGCFTGTPASLIEAAKRDRTGTWTDEIKPFSQKDADYAYVAARLNRMAQSGGDL